MMNEDDMKISEEEIRTKCEGSSFNPEEIEQLIKNQKIAEKFHHLKEKLKEIEDESYVLDRLDACDTSETSKILREFLTSKE